MPVGGGGSCGLVTVEGVVGLLVGGRLVGRGAAAGFCTVGEVSAELLWMMLVLLTVTWPFPLNCAPVLIVWVTVLVTALLLVAVGFVAAAFTLWGVGVGPGAGVGAGVGVGVGFSAHIVLGVIAAGRAGRVCLIPGMFEIFGPVLEA